MFLECIFKFKLIKTICASIAYMYLRKTTTTMTTTTTRNPTLDTPTTAYMESWLAVVPITKVYMVQLS